jgi:hydroxymethylbilane synthase|tara:strand:- start:555 stop:1475 length:921 start_codon:yes stop_codon:yes gene_type:complete
MLNKIIIGSRGSKLSLAYANKVKSLILSGDQATSKKITIETIKTSGDLFQDKRISEIGGKNLFCKEIEDNLIKKKIDIAVHSLKDMDSIETKGLVIQAYIKRNDPRESFVSKKYQKLSDSKGAKIGSSSRRRELQLKLFDKNVKVASIRGNIDTRIKKIESGEYDGAVLALAGLKMLSLEKYAKEIFPIKDFIPTAGQGIIAVQCREEDETIRKILRKINHTETEICALTERSFLKTLGGDCNTAVGCSAILKKENIQLNAQLFSDDGKKVFNVVKLGKLNEPQLLGKLAGEEILKKSGNSFVKKR